MPSNKREPPFRVQEVAKIGLLYAESYLLPQRREVGEYEYNRSSQAFYKALFECGPVIESYPSWHPLVSNHDIRRPQRYPGEKCGYRGLDNSRYFSNGFITCPLDGAEEVINSVKNLPPHPAAEITATRLDVTLFHPKATPILVKCNWNKDYYMNDDGTINKGIAVPLMLEQILPGWKSGEFAETWESMRQFFLGSPHGSRSSLLINKETGQAMKSIWQSMINTGMYGPIKKHSS